MSHRTMWNNEFRIPRETRIQRICYSVLTRQDNATNHFSHHSRPMENLWLNLNFNWGWFVVVFKTIIILHYFKPTIKMCQYSPVVILKWTTHIIEKDSCTSHKLKFVEWSTSMLKLLLLSLFVVFVFVILVNKFE